MSYKFGDIVVGNSSKYSYTYTNTLWMVVFAYDIRNFGETIPHIRIVGTTDYKNRNVDFFKEYADALLGNYEKWITRFTRDTAYDMVNEMREWMRQFDRYLRYEFVTFEVAAADFDMVRAHFVSNKQGSLSLKKLGD